MSIADILALATLIKNETGINKNTAIRIGNALEEIIKYFRDNGGSGGTSFVGAPITTTEALDAAFTPGVYGVNLPANYQDWEDKRFSLMVMPYAEYPINAFQVVIFSTLSLPFSYKIYIRFGNSAANPKWTPWGSISGGGGVGSETDPVFMTWLATSPISHFFGNNTLELATADMLDDLFAPGDYGIHVNAGFQGKTNMNLTVKFASNDGTGGDGDQDYFQIIKFETGEEFIRKYEHVSTGAGNWSAWSSKIALQSWVTENFALKESGVVPPISEDILLTTAAPSYTVVAETADNINVSSTAAAGTIVLNVLAADKALKISVKAGSNAVTIAGTAYNAGVVVFAVFTESTGTWSVDSTLDPVIPDYSDVKVQKRTTTAPQQMQFSYVISGLPAGGGAKGHLIFIDIPGSAFSGVYSSLVTFAGTTTYAQKIIEGTALNVVRVGSGAVYHSEYDGANLASLKFNSIAEVNTAANFKTKLETLTADNRLSESAIKLSTVLYNGVNSISLDFSKEVNKITLDAAGTLAILIDTFTNVPLIDGQRTVLLKNNRASSVNVSFKTTDLVVGDITYSFTNLTLPVITVYASKVAEISYLLLFSSSTACQVYITSVAQP